MKMDLIVSCRREREVIHLTVKVRKKSLNFDLSWVTFLMLTGEADYNIFLQAHVCECVTVLFFLSISIGEKIKSSSYMSVHKYLRKHKYQTSLRIKYINLSVSNCHALLCSQFFSRVEKRMYERTIFRWMSFEAKFRSN